MTSMAGNWSRNRACASALVLAATLLVPLSVSLSLAQQAPPTPGPRPPLPQAKAPAPTARDLPPATEGGLQRRVEQLEEQLVDLQVIDRHAGIARQGRNGASPRSAGRSRPRRRPSMPPMPAASTPSRRRSGRWLPSWRTCRTRCATSAPAGADRRRPAAAAASRRASAPSPSRPSAQRDEIDRVLSPPPGGGGPRTAATQPPGGGQAEPDVPPQQLYEQAYGYLLQKDYGAAETGFDDFLKRHPNHQLAGNAQYWLGESHLCARPIPGRGRCLPQGLSEPRQEPESARNPS